MESKSRHSPHPTTTWRRSRGGYSRPRLPHSCSRFYWRLPAPLSGPLRLSALPLLQPQVCEEGILRCGSKSSKSLSGRFTFTGLRSRSQEGAGPLTILWGKYCLSRSIAHLPTVPGEAGKSVFFLPLPSVFPFWKKEDAQSTCQARVSSRGFRMQRDGGRAQGLSSEG